MWKVNYKCFFMFFWMLFTVSVMTGCSISPEAKKSVPVFYPPLPNPPRIQHLLSLTSLADLNQSSSNFADFILGKQTPESLVTKPYGIAMHDGKIYVVDAAKGGYVVLNLVTGKSQFVSGGAAGRMKKPINITIDSDGTKYISDTGRAQILLFDKDDDFQRSFGIKGQFRPSDVAITEDKLFVTDLNHHKIHVLEKSTGKSLGQIGSVGSKDGEFFFPTNLAIGPKEYLYVTDTGNFRVQKFTLEGKYVSSFGSIGSGLGKFARPKGLTLDNDGNLYVVDAAFENVQLVNKEGKLLLYFGQPGDKASDINLPADISIDYKNVKLFQPYADPDFKLEYVLLVTSQFGVNKINIFGFGRMQGMEY